MKHDIDRIRSLYFEEHKTQREIAEILGTSENVIQGIFSRNKMSAIYRDRAPQISDELLVDLYCIQMKPLSDLVKLFGVKSTTPIRNRLIKLGIPIRNQKQQPRKIRITGLDFNLIQDQFLIRSAVDIARDLNVSPSFIDKLASDMNWKKPIPLYDLKWRSVSKDEFENKSNECLIEDHQLNHYQINKARKFHNIHSFRSEPERKICEFLNSLNVKFETNVRNIIPPLELDIWIPEKNLAIEVNGIYWHTEKFIPKDYHLNKTIECEKQGINLLHFWDHEILNQTSVIQNIIQSKLGMNEKIGARKCKIGLVNSSTARKFHSMNHLSGFCAASKHIGLFFDDNLVSLASFGRSRFDKNHIHELIRFSSSSRITVVGGFSRLVNFFNPNSLISYANRRISSGKVYQSCGFELIRSTEPGYCYSNGSQILSRFQCQKKYLKCEGSESQIMNLLGYNRLWDSGNLVFSLKL